MASAEVVHDAARRLGTVGIDVMPIKGALLQHWLYDDPADRSMTDVDLLVRPPELDSAVRTLTAGGYEPMSRSSIGAHVLRSRHGLALDLHPRLFDGARYRLPTDAIFARSAIDESLYGTRVCVPAPLDAYAHLIGKFGSDHANATAIRRLDEIVRMGRLVDATPACVAQHLVDVGMRRVARYVLPLVAAVGDPTAHAIHAALPPDPIGVMVATVARATLESPRTGPTIGALAAHALNHSLPSAARSGARALARRRRR